MCYRVARDALQIVRPVRGTRPTRRADSARRSTRVRMRQQECRAAERRHLQ